MAGKKGMKHYSGEVKREAVRLSREEGKSQAEIIQALGINEKKGNRIPGRHQMVVILHPCGKQ